MLHNLRTKKSRIGAGDYEDKELMYSEYSHDVNFYKEVLLKQWNDMWKLWQEQWDNYHNDPFYG